MPEEDENSAGRSMLGGDTTLARLAELLDCPVEVFTDGAHAPPDVRQSRELIALWTAINDQADREEVLRFMRNLARA